MREEFSRRRVMTPLATVFTTLAQRFIAWRQRERAFAELSALDDHTLADLGLRRADIPMVVYGYDKSEPAAAVVEPLRLPANSNLGRRAA
jgi:uncharacterized protein YjiS (DUF1127 family)